MTYLDLKADFDQAQEYLDTLEPGHPGTLDTLKIGWILGNVPWNIGSANRGG